jgi:hypothetical protein
MFVRDLDSKDRDTISFFLTTDEQSKLLALADSVNFWAMPTNFAGSNSITIPNEGHCSLRIKDAKRDHTISWLGNFRDVRDEVKLGQAMKVANVAFDALDSRPEFKALPAKTWFRY